SIANDSDWHGRIHLPRRTAHEWPLPFSLPDEVAGLILSGDVFVDHTRGEEPSVRAQLVTRWSGQKRTYEEGDQKCLSQRADLLFDGRLSAGALDAELRVNGGEHERLDAAAKARLLLSSLLAGTGEPRIEHVDLDARVDWADLSTLPLACRLLRG